jgi:hypothetical protein
VLAALGLDNYNAMRNRSKVQFINLAEKIKTKILEFLDPSSSSMIFTEGLKKRDLDLVYRMMKKEVEIPSSEVED